jgi:hypothetical protein
MSRILPKTAIRYLLVSSTPIAAIIGTRCGPLAQTQKTKKPYIVLTTVSGDHQHHLGGASGLTFERIQVDAYAETAAQLNDLADAIRNRLDGIKKTTVTVPASDSEPQGTLEIDACILVDDSDESQAPNDGKDLGDFRHRLDFRVSAAEPIPSLT